MDVGSRRVLAGLACLILLAHLTGCGSTEDQADGDDRVAYTVGIDIPFHPLFAYVAARRETYFADAPYEVRFEVLDTSSLLPSFGDGELDVIATFPSFLPRIEERYGVVAQQFQPLARIARGMGVWVPVESPAQSLDDLHGQLVATPPLGQQWGEDEAMVVAATGETIREIFDVSESAAPVQQLLQGRVAAAFVGVEVETAVQEAGGLRLLLRSDEVFAEAYDDTLVLSGGLVADARLIDEDARLIRDLRHAFLDAWDRWAEDRDAVVEVAARHSGVPPEQLLAVGEALGLTAADGRRDIDPKDVETWGQLFEALARSGFLDAAPSDPAKYFRVP